MDLLLISKRGACPCSNNGENTVRAKAMAVYLGLETKKKTMKNYTIKYEMESEPSEFYTWTDEGACIGDALYNFYRSESDFSYETPIVIDIAECVKS